MTEKSDGKIDAGKAAPSISTEDPNSSPYSAKETNGKSSPSFFHKQLLWQ